MSRGPWKRPIKNTRGRSTGKGQLPCDCPKCGRKLERARNLGRHLQTCKGSLPSQPKPAPLHPLAASVQEQVVISDTKVSEILFSIDSQSTSPVVLHFWGPPGCGKTHLSRNLARAYQAPLLELDTNSWSSLISVQKKFEEFKKMESNRRKFVIINEVDENHRRMIERSLKEVIDTEPWVYLLTSNSTQEKPLGFQAKFMDRVHRQWQFSSYSDTLNALLEKQIQNLEKDNIVVDTDVRNYFFDLCSKKGYRTFLQKFCYCVEITKFQKLSSLQIFQ